MKRYSSPNGTMELNPDGGWMTVADHFEIMERVPVNFVEHMLRHDAYERRARDIITTYREEHALSPSIFFDAGLAVHGESTSICTINIDTKVRGMTDVPTSLFDTDDMSVVVEAARKDKAAQDEARAAAQRLRAEAKERDEKAELARLIQIYPDELKSLQKRSTDN